MEKETETRLLFWKAGNLLELQEAGKSSSSLLMSRSETSGLENYKGQTSVGFLFCFDSVWFLKQGFSV